MAPKDEKSSGTKGVTNAGKEFRCNKAGCKSKGFNSLGAQQRHEREQHNDEPKCKYCEFTAKRRYHMKTHMVIDHPELIANAAADVSMGRGFRGSIGSRSPEGSASNDLQNPPTDHESFSDSTTNLPHSLAYASSDPITTQHLTGPPYALNAYTAYNEGENRDTLSIPDGQAQSPSGQPSYLTAIRWNPPTRPSRPDTHWESQILPSHPAHQNVSFSGALPMNRPNQSTNLFTQTPTYQSGTDRDIRYYNSPYSSHPNEQATIFSTSMQNTDIVQSGQYRISPGQPPTRPQ